MKSIFFITLIFVYALNGICQDKIITLSVKEQLFSVNQLKVDTTPIKKKDSITHEVFVDTSRVVPLGFRSNIFPMDTDEYGNKTMQLQKIEAYPIVICNSSNSAKSIQIQDSKLVMYQEAQDSLSNWLPIEYFVHSDCGLSYSNIELPSQYCLESKIAKYKGAFKTKLRVKILIDESIKYSNIYSGSVNYVQFTKPHEGFKDLRFK